MPSKKWWLEAAAPAAKVRRKIYVASSWRNERYPRIVEVLNGQGHEVYDFRNPAPGNNGFSWSEIDEAWWGWRPAEFVEKLTTHPRAAEGFRLDAEALDWADTCVMVMPCGRSAHLEAGYAIGQGKETFILLSDERCEPELMYLLATKIVTNTDELVAALGGEDEEAARERRLRDLDHEIECAEVHLIALKWECAKLAR